MQNNQSLIHSSSWDDESQILSVKMCVGSESFTDLYLFGWMNGIRWSLWFDNQLDEYESPFDPSPFPANFLLHPLLDCWQHTIPTEVLARIPKDWPNPIGLLNVLSRDKYAYQLFVTNPLLFLLLFQHAACYHPTRAWLIAHCRLKRIDILRVCGLPARPALVKLLSKITLPTLSIYYCDLLTRAIALDYAVLNHRKSISTALLNTVVHFPILLHSSLLQHWQDEFQYPIFEILTRIEILQEVSKIPRKDIDKALLNCYSVKAIKHVYERLQQFGYLNRVLTKAARFPTAPIPGNDSIVPITNYPELLAEGNTQMHCIPGYQQAIMAGQYYVYQVLEPERATLGIKIHRSHLGSMTLSIDQLKASENASVGETTWQQIKQWIQRTVVSIHH